ncbi:unnamed protein product [Polarella glacialis]|uniref:Uncharacterized protein n=1 Tax=Polarella glacialis TaxID=89957 RepID=A0A813FI65_POLGL|nr:unnamed protein product [Polarella glacialis]
MALQTQAVAGRCRSRLLLFALLVFSWVAAVKVFQGFKATTVFALAEFSAFGPCAHAAGRVQSRAYAEVRKSDQVPTKAIPSRKDPLVRRLRMFQSISDENLVRWNRFCDEHLDGRRDPARHDAETLKAFLAAVQPLAREVSKIQSKNKTISSNWQELCDTKYPRRGRDPYNYGEDILQNFLVGCKIQAPNEIRLLEDLDAEKIVFIKAVKSFQLKHGEDGRKLWLAACDKDTPGELDPAVFSKEFLLSFLQEAGFEPDPIEQTRLLVMRVKWAQKGQGGHQSWVSFCDNLDLGGHDPSMVEARFLREFLTKFATMPKPSGAMFEAAASLTSPRHPGASSGRADNFSRAGGKATSRRTDRPTELMVQKPQEKNGHLEKALEPATAVPASKKVQSNELEGKAEFAKKVQMFQSMNYGHVKKWNSFCDSQLGGRRDPFCHDAETLKAFLAHAHPLVRAVTQLQSKDNSARQLWDRLCKTEYKGKGNDPYGHSEAVLRDFLKRCNATELGETIKSQMRSAQHHESEVDIEKIGLVKRVKRLQIEAQTSQDKSRWLAFCRRHGSKVFDPVNFSKESLRLFLKEAGVTPSHPEEVAALVKKVKAYQRRGAENYAKWKDYCQSCGLAGNDPSMMDTAELQHFLGIE